MIPRGVALCCCVAWLAGAAVDAQDAVQWLAALQWISAELRDSGNDGARSQQLARELRLLAREIETAGLEIPPPPAAMDSASLQAYAAQLRASLEDYERTRPGGAFRLGRIEVQVTAEAPQLSAAATVDENLYRLRNAFTLAEALLPVAGINLDRIGQRNEMGAFVRGFDVRQTPVYVDGIPVYVPYDGYLDLERFLTAGVSQIEIAKGFTSPLYGPNAIGGAINLVSKEPAEPWYGEVGFGYGSGEQVHSYVNGGLRRSRFWAQGSFSWLSSDSFPLSGDFRGTPAQPPGRRLNAYRTDSVVRARFAWTPSQNEQYSFTYANQNAEKGQPPYAGTDPAVRIRYWQWPQWDKQSYYLIASRNFGARTYLRARLFRDQFQNTVKSFDDARYATQLRPSSFTSVYDDATNGAIAELGSGWASRQTLKAAFYVKDDRHHQFNVGQPAQSFRDLSLSLGAEDTIRLFERTRLVLGLSTDRIQNRRADDLRGGAVLPFPRAHLAAWNFQAGLWQGVSESGRLRLTFARKTRLPTLKDRYSYRLGTSIPNPFLRQEQASNWEAGYSQLLGKRSLVEAALFASWLNGAVDRFYVEPNVYQLRNLGRTRHLGAELSVRSSPISRLDVTANYTYLSRRNLTDPGWPPLGAPRHRVYAMGSARLTPRVTLFADWYFESGRLNRNDAGRLWFGDEISVAGAGGVVSLGRGLEVQIGAGNLFDRNYSLLEGYPEPGRHGYINLRYRF
jgi:iron complex outermembrane receptor protein